MRELSLKVIGPANETYCQLTIAGPVELGRQRSNKEPVYALIPDMESTRLNIAPADGGQDVLSIPRTFLRIESIGPRRIRATNLHQRANVGCIGREDLWPQSSLEYELPMEFTIASRRITVAVSGVSEPAKAAPATVQRAISSRLARPATDPHMQSLVWEAAAPGRSLIAPAVAGLDATSHATAARSLVHWFQAVTEVLHRAVNSDDFFQEAVRAVVDLVGLDSGRVLLWRHGAWETAAIAVDERRSSRATAPSERMLERLRSEKRTFWHETIGDDTRSLAGIHGVLAAPILDPAGAVIGALYADRASDGHHAKETISELDAMLVETIAGGVAAGLARLEQQRAAIAAQLRFEQFFTPELSQYLVSQPDLLEGRDKEVTLLFCDIRNFSRISEHLSPRETMEWIGAVMTALSDCVIAEQGVLVDYIGDELLAMWGAPRDQADHAAAACRAAIRMTKTVLELSDAWQTRIAAPIRVGIGINSGRAHVGNTGSQRKFKYGPLGNTVNVASRVQGITKQLHTTVLITEATHQRLPAEFERRKLCTARLYGIEEPLGLYELLPDHSPVGAKLRADYEVALNFFDQRRFQECLESLEQLLAEFPQDGPAQVLLARTQKLLSGGEEVASTVWEVPTK